ncbi:hypothetical protein K431DRAFT_350216 [Polychaeton citri CBS 116435]|uniref:Uncharacterized protein n=1 Tax=Polychaeton citri CBS 116435 TaxID=1314669 RepID=A0A9P4Q1E0_9PEZI|nr:hypothetical protein K431DRAFT_350216 [Polychaeton citri CBS 116435]
MASTYTSFLDTPSASALAQNASISYVTTTTTISEAGAIIKHLSAQGKHLEFKQRRVLNAVESSNGLCLETETTILFKSGGGAYLPQLDENLLDERQVTVPIVHTVRFADNGKIQSIRLYWDQATLLRQVEAIGRSGRNWPIRDGTAQISTIKSSIEAAGNKVGVTTNGSKPLPRQPNEVVIDQHKKSDFVSAIGDPHASLSLFAHRDPNENAGERYTGPTHATRASAKPAPRDYNEIFAEDDEVSGTPSRSRSPTKADGVILKAGAGKNFPKNRLFDENEKDSNLTSPERKKKTYQQKYEHFNFGDREEPPSTSRPTTSSGRSQTNSHFSFEEFTAPPKPSEKSSRKDYDRHWGSGIDEDYGPTPPKRHVVHEPRKDAETHFEIADKVSVTDSAKPKSLQRQKGMGIYSNPLQDEDTTPKPSSRNTTSTDANRRREDFASQYSATDGAPLETKQAAQHKKQGSKTALQPNWGFGSPVQEKKIYKTAGDGMGGRSGARSWGIGDDSDPEVNTDIRPSARSRKQAEAGADDF